MDRIALYRRIDERVDAMMARGLDEEVRRLLATGYPRSLPSLKSLGYKEMAASICGEIDRATALESIKQNTRRYAKRQQTWFRAEPGIVWCDVTACDAETATAMLFGLMANAL